MANIKSAGKRAKQAQKRRLHNTHLRSRTITALKKAIRSVRECEEKKDEALLKKAIESVRLAMRHIDKMVPKGIFHKNKAARLKSRLNARLKKVAQS